MKFFSVRNIIASLLSGALLFISTGLHPVYWLTWFAPVPVLIAALFSTPRNALPPAFIAYLIGSIGWFTYLSGLAPPVLAVVFIVIPALIFAVTIWLSRWIQMLTHSSFAFILAVAAIWTSYEFLLTMESANGSASSWAYYQSDFIPILQLASVTGHLGITFLQLFIAASIAVSIHQILSGKKLLASLFPALAASLIFLAVYVFGSLRINEVSSAQNIKGALISVGTNNDFVRTKNREEALKVIASYTAQIDSLKGEGIQIVVLPEKIAGITDEYADTVARLFSSCASRNQLMLVAGLNRMKQDSLFNEAWVFNESGDWIVNYRKNYFVPGFESGYIAGNKTAVIPKLNTQLGIQICKDMDFPQWSILYGRQQATLMLIPAWDFVKDGYLHSRMAVMRGVENGFSEMRSAQDGNLTFSDAYGRIIAETSSGHESPSVLKANIGTGSGITFFSKYGNWFGWLNVFMLCVLILYAAVKRGMKKSQ